ncbi:MAG: DUF2147 domain-containing protein [Chitinivibrionales bacterium]|nr:DUF2147 domain-containing protein [Chitinivibrionales bacterium]
MTKTNKIWLFLLSLASVLLAENPDAITGKWINEEKDAVIEIYKNNTTYSGKIIWAEEQAEKNKTVTDKNNPEPSLRSRPIVGLVILKNFTYDGTNTWKGGTIYDPNNGKTYQCTISLAGNGNLHIRGYFGMPVFGRTTTWWPLNEKAYTDSGIVRKKQ